MNSPVYFRLVCAFCLIVSSNLALAATKIPAELYRQLESTKSLELIVEYDDTEIENTINDMRSKLPTRRDNVATSWNFNTIRNQNGVSLQTDTAGILGGAAHLPAPFLL